jgi:hypothetical protein
MLGKHPRAMLLRLDAPCSIIGKIAFSGSHQWVFMGASVNTDEKHPVGWENQFMAGIKVGISVFCYGRLSTLDMVQQFSAGSRRLSSLLQSWRLSSWRLISDMKVWMKP